MVMNKKDHEIIEKTAIEHFKDKKIVSKCPRCNGNMTVIENGTSFVVKCVNDCILGTFRGI